MIFSCPTIRAGSHNTTFTTYDISQMSLLDTEAAKIGTSCFGVKQGVEATIGENMLFEKFQYVLQWYICVLELFFD